MTPNSSMITLLYPYNFTQVAGPVDTSN